MEWSVEFVAAPAYRGGLEYARDASDAEFRRLANVFGHIFSASMLADGLQV